MVKKVEEKLSDIRVQELKEALNEIDIHNKELFNELFEK